MCLMLWNNLNKLVCLISSHIYLFMSIYISEDPKPNDFLYRVDMYFEIFFAFSMVIEFLTDFVPFPGYQSIRDPLLIA